jgi:phage N-6-adenine-methyltransferase
MDGHNSVLFSKKGDEWETPKSLFNKLNEEFDFVIDAACTTDNMLCPYGFTHEWLLEDTVLSDALKRDWTKQHDVKGNLMENPHIFLNPPYSKIGAFLKKAYEESEKGAVVVCLIPCRCDTKYWHNYVMKAKEIRFIIGRVKFANRTLPSWNADGNFKLSSAPFPSAAVVFQKHNQWVPTIRSMEWK